MFLIPPPPKKWRISRLGDEFVKMQLMLQEQNGSLESRLSELEVRFHNRESREEDVKRIREVN